METYTLWPLSQGEIRGKRNAFIDLLFDRKKIPMTKTLASSTQLLLYQSEIEVHHAIEQQVLTKYPGLFTEDEILFDIRNLRGICGNYAKQDLHRRQVRALWDQYYEKWAAKKVTPTRLDVILAARYIDNQFGQLFYPYYNPSLNPSLP